MSQINNPPTSDQWAAYGQALCPMLRDTFMMNRNGFMAEGRAFEMMRASASVKDMRGSVASVFRSHEFGPVDGNILCVDAPADDQPAADSSYFERWQWLRRRGENCPDFLPADIKFWSLTLGREHERLRYYAWSDPVKGDRVQTENQVMFLIVEGVYDHVAVVPAGVYEQAISDAMEGQEPLIRGVPFWIALFMVHVDDLDVAIARLQAAVTYGTTYTNPTLGVEFRGWKPRRGAKVAVAGVARTQVTSLRAMLVVWQKFHARGWAIDFCSAQPCLYDFSVAIPTLGLFGFEHKAGEPLPSIITNPRRDPFGQTRLWHFFYRQVGADAICIARNHSHLVCNKDGTLNDDFVRQHTFSDFDRLARYIEQHATAAKEAVVEALRRMTCDDIWRGLCDDYPTRWLERISQGLDGTYEQAIRKGEQTSLPWLTKALNDWCQRGARAIAFSVGRGHGLGNHVFVQHEWTDAERTAYRDHGKLPLSLWDAATADRKCIVLNCLDLLPARNRTAIEAPFGIRSSDWKKQIPHTYLDKRFLIIGSTVKGHLHETLSVRSSSHAILPSEFTTIYDPKSTLDPPDPTLQSTGAHLFRPGEKQRDWRQDLKTARPNSPFTGKFLKKGIELVSYQANLANGELYRQLCDVLDGEGDVTVGDSTMPNRKTFAAEMYQVSVREVLQCAWDFGYAPAWGGRNKTTAKDKRKSKANDGGDEGNDDFDNGDGEGEDCFDGEDGGGWGVGKEVREGDEGPKAKEGEGAGEEEEEEEDDDGDRGPKPHIHRGRR